MESEERLADADDRLSFNCTLCAHTSAGKSALLQHCRSVKHLQMEQLHLLQRRAEGAPGQPEIGDIFTVTRNSTAADKDHHLKSGKKSSKVQDSMKNANIANPWIKICN